MPPTAQSKQEQKHTPTPWQAFTYSKNGTPTGIWYVTNGHGLILADDLNEQDACFIITACNQHAALLASNAELETALKAVKDMLVELHHDHADNWPKGQIEQLREVGELARKALQHAAEATR